MQLVLYGTDYCQLCDEAENLVHQTLEGRDYQLVITDISESEQLMDRYALKIPVLSRAEGTAVELGWPFSAADILALLADNERHC